MSVIGPFQRTVSCALLLLSASLGGPARAQGAPQPSAGAPVQLQGPASPGEAQAAPPAAQVVPSTASDAAPPSAPASGSTAEQSSSAPTAPSAEPVQSAPGPSDASAPPTPQAPPRDFNSSEAPPNLETRPGQGLEPGPEVVPEKKVYADAALIDGHVREGPFLSGPGSLTFILHHTLLGAGGGLVTQAVPHHFSLEVGSRESMLAGTLIGAGLGFGVSAYWQFSHWVGKPAATFGVVNSVLAGMAATGFMNLLSTDANLLSWTAFVGAELGAWLTMAVAGGEMTLESGAAVSSGAGWGAAYMGLILAIMATSGTALDGRTITDALLLAPGIGAAAMAISLLKLHPTTTQVLRADLFGAGVGGVVLLISGIVLGGFYTPTPYILSLLGSAGAIAVVSLLWDERAEKHSSVLHPGARQQPYRNVWW